MSLTEELTRLKEQFSGQAPAETLKTMADAIERLAKTGIVERSLKRGDKAPDFTLPNVSGNMVSSSALLRAGPIVLSFYRGVW